MKKKSILATAGLAVGFAGVTAVIVAGTPRTKKATAFRYGPPTVKVFAKLRPGDAETGLQLPDFGQAPEPPNPTPNDLALRVRATHRVMADTDIPAVNKTAAEQLNRARLGLTPHRLAHFKWIDNDPEIRVHGWAGYVLGVDEIPGGTLLTVRVTPAISKGTSATTTDYSIEKYSIIDGQVNFVVGIDPPDASPGISVTD